MTHEGVCDYCQKPSNCTWHDLCDHCASTLSKSDPLPHVDGRIPLSAIRALAELSETHPEKDALARLLNAIDMIDRDSLSWYALRTALGFAQIDVDK